MLPNPFEIYISPPTLLLPHYQSVLPPVPVWRFCKRCVKAPINTKKCIETAIEKKVGCSSLTCLQIQNKTKFENFLKMSNKIQNSDEQGIFDETGCLPPCDFFELNIEEKEPLDKYFVEDDEEYVNATILGLNFYMPEGHFVENEQVQEIRHA